MAYYYSITLADAAKIGRLDIATALLDYGVDPNEQDSQALIEASKEGHADIVKLLLDCGADPAAQRSLSVSEAAKGGHVAIWRLLTSYGAIHEKWTMALALSYTT